MTELILMRHGQTDANSRGIYCGSTDMPLTDAGRKGVADTARHLPKFNHVFSSDMQRARQTADIVAPNAAIEYLPALRETDFGDFEGLTANEIQTRMPGAWQSFVSDHSNFTFPNGDNVTAYAKSAAGTAKRIAATHDDESVLIVTHKGFIL
ncbi:MAG: histidine phosphatase family protein, partial [Eubacteriales bacterium]|nr:histidine phosphatase family protein [Eubacteriales bacterium]